MRCASCGTDNREGRRFCASCGARLTVTCPSCGTPNEPGEAFCGECGNPLAAPTATAATAMSTAATVGPANQPAESARRERKVATILFADVVGFTSLNEAHDPELVQGLVTRAFTRLAGEVERYEGLLEKFAGDAMLALFGVPQTHEDDAERAVRAALEMQAAMAGLAAELRAEGKPELAMRIGIETGEVLVDQARAANERDRIVTGDPVNTAARLQAASAVGTVTVGAGTYAATRSLIDYEELPPFALKGKSVAVAAWRAIAVKARRGGQRAPLGIEAPLIGREAETGLLKETVRRAVAERRPHLVTVLGTAGVGKSRITWELEKYLDGLPEPYVWRKGRCLAYGQTSLGALAEVLRSDAGLRDDDPASVAVEALDARLDALPVTFDANVRLVIRGVAGIGDLPRISHDELFGVLQRYLEALAQVAPAVFVFEDIHWADDGLLDLIEYLARWGNGPITVLALARHELLERRPAWAGGIANATTLVLEPLDAEHNGQLLDGLLPGGIPDDLRERIVQLADGNPLFTEELVRMFVDRGVVRFVDGRWQLAQAIEELEVPGSVQAVLAARLDALPDREKRLAQDAAVVGRIFWDAVLAYLGGERAPRVDDLLRRLRVKELVVPREPSSLSGAAEFGFRHVLIRDVAYDSLPKQDRAAKHLLVAQWAERELGERSEELAELLASHFLSALRYREEFGGSPSELRGLRERTYHHARVATERAGRLYERAAAARWGRIAAELAETLELPAGERVAASELFLRHAFGNYPLDEGIAIARRAIATASAVPDPSPELVTLAASCGGYLIFSLFSTDRRDEAAEAVAELLRLAEREPLNRQARGIIRSREGWMLWRTDRPAEAVPILESAIEDARSAGDSATEAWAVHDLGIAKTYSGRAEEGIGHVRDSLRLAREAGDTSTLMRAHANLPSLLMDYGAPWSEVEEHLAEGLRAAQRSVDYGMLGWLLFQQSQAAELQLRLPDAERLLRESIAMAEAYGELTQAVGRRHGLAFNLIVQGRWDEARQTVATIRRPSMVGDSAIWFHVFDALFRWHEDPVEGEQMLVDALQEVAYPNKDVGVNFLTRMRFRRLGPEGARAAIVFAPAAAESEGPIPSLGRRWTRTLGLEAASAAAELEVVAAEFDERGYRLWALWVRHDRLLALQRAGGDISALRQSIEETEAASGARDLFELVPEARSLTPSETTAAAAGA